LRDCKHSGPAEENGDKYLAARSNDFGYANCEVEP